MVVAGCLLAIITLAVAVAVAVLPGPGGISTFAADKSLILRSSP